MWSDALEFECILEGLSDEVREEGDKLGRVSKGEEKLNPSVINT